MDSSITMQFVMMRAQAELAAGNGAELAAEHVFLGILKLAELQPKDITPKEKYHIKAFHSGIGRMLRNTRYLGDEFYPPIIDKDTFNTAEAERIMRAERLGRTKKFKQEKEVVYPTIFRKKEGTEELDDPFGQAEYAYSLIEMEVNKNGSQ